MPTILIINNHKAACDMLCEILSSRGYKMRAASDIQAGLNLIKQRPDLVICDHEPPSLDGLSFLQTLRHNPATAAIPAIICTSQTDPQLQQTALQLGVCAYINKPFELNLLTDPIAAQLKPGDSDSRIKIDSTKTSGTSMAWSYFTAMVGD
jgi:CheY-like chemotaxis protein